MNDLIPQICWGKTFSKPLVVAEVKYKGTIYRIVTVAEACPIIVEVKGSDSVGDPCWTTCKNLQDTEVVISLALRAIAVRYEQSPQYVEAGKPVSPREPFIIVK